MAEIKMETQEESSCPSGTCPDCEKKAEEARQHEEMSLAFLLALLPVITLTFFGQAGLL